MGKKTKKFKGGEQYYGEMDHGIRQGYGTQVWPNFGKYQGFWEKDKMEGHGIFSWYQQKKQYMGNFANNEMNGYGVMIHELDRTNTTTTISQGTFRDGLLHGMAAQFKVEEQIVPCPENNTIDNPNAKKKIHKISTLVGTDWNSGELKNGWKFDDDKVFKVIGDKEIQFVEKTNTEEENTSKKETNQEVVPTKEETKAAKLKLDEIAAEKIHQLRMLLRKSEDLEDIERTQTSERIANYQKELKQKNIQIEMMQIRLQEMKSTLQELDMKNTSISFENEAMKEFIAKKGFEQEFLSASTATSVTSSLSSTWDNKSPKNENKIIEMDEKENHEKLNQNSISIEIPNVEEALSPIPAAKKVTTPNEYLSPRTKRSKRYADLNGEQKDAEFLDATSRSVTSLISKFEKFKK